MKDLELIYLGIEEINVEEMKEINGGFWQTIVGGVGAYLAISAIEYPNAFIDGLLCR